MAGNLNSMNDTEISNRISTNIILQSELTYSNLCKLLDIKPKSGNTKISDLKILERFIDYEKVGTKFIIKKIYDKPKKKADQRANGNRSIYVPCIEKILLEYFIAVGKREVELTKTMLWQKLGMISKLYIAYYDNEDFLNEIKYIRPSAKQWHINRAYSNSSKKMNSITRSALDSLQRRKLIKYEYETNLWCRQTNGYYREVTDKEKEIVLQCEREALLEVECKNINEVYLKNCIKNYSKIKNAKLVEYLDMSYTFCRYKIICNRKYLQQGLNETIEELQSLKVQLNNAIINYLNGQAKKEYEKNQEDYYVNFTTDFKFESDYVEIQKLILSNILNIDAMLIEELEKYWKEQNLQKNTEELDSFVA